MLGDSKKISIRQAVFLFTTIILTPAIRVIPIYTSERAEQAAWLSPGASIVSLILLSLIWQSFYKRYRDHSLMDIYYDILGKIPGKFLVFMYLLWLIILTALYLRYFASRFVSSIYTNMNASIFIIIILVLITYSLRRGLSTLARLNEVVFPLLAVSFFALIVFILPNIRTEFLEPVSYRSILPVLNASVGIIGILSYFTFIFIIGDMINNKESIRKVGFQISLFLLITITLTIIATLGSFSYAVVKRTQLPFLMAVKQISLFDTLERIESVVISTWIISDFVLISFFILCILHLFKSLFKLSDIRPLININAILLYLLSLFLANNIFELQTFSNDFAIYSNIAFGVIIPIIVFFIGKIRKKV